MLNRTVLLLTLLAGLQFAVRAESLLDIGNFDALSPQSVFVVNTTGDQSDTLPGDGFCNDGAGSCSLRGAIEEANAFPGGNVIDFDIPGGCPQTIAPLAPLPAIVDAVSINGYSQFGALPNAAQNGSDAVICVQVSGAFAGAAADGLRLNAGNSTVRGLAIYQFSDAGIEINGNGTVVEGNYIGSNAANSAALPNRLGVFILGNTNRIGGSTLTSRNVIVGNTRAGVSILEPAAGNTLQNNYIGLNRASAAMGNGESGVIIFRGSTNTIGGATSNLRNVISANGVNAVGGLDASGIYVFGDALIGNAPNNTIQGNYIGTDPNGIAAIPNLSNGVRIDGAGNASVLGNLISGNLSAGVRIASASANGTIIRGNTIGLDSARVNDLGNGSDGIAVDGSGGNELGGAGVGDGNWIAGNNRYGIYISGAGAENNLVRGNFIGYNSLGNQLPQTAGVVVYTSNNTIGGTTTGARNAIAGNSTWNILANGVSGMTIRGNYVGLTHTGVATTSPTTYGIILQDVTNSAIGGATTGAGNVVSGNQTGIVLTSSGITTTGVTIQGNLVGTNVAGTAAIPNNNGISLLVADGNTIGGTTPETRNVISGNSLAGINIQPGANNVIQGNYIGTAITGLTAVPNGNGINVAALESSDNLIGGTAPGAGNLISGNLQNGVQINNRANTNRIEGNIVGLNANADTALPNGGGISLFDRAASNAIGGTAAGAGNVVSGNNGTGVFLSDGATLNRVEGNKIGTNPAGNAGIGNLLGGVRILEGSGGVFSTTGNAIGGTTPAARNIVSGNFQGGILVQGATTTVNTIAGNYVGSAANGVDMIRNGFFGVKIDAPGNTVGGPTSASRNVISGHISINDSGLFVTANGANTIIRNNYLGSTAAGDQNLFNGINLTLSGAGSTVDSNLIVGASYGIKIQNTSNIFVTNNVMGLDATQSYFLGNGFGVWIENSSNVRVGEDNSGNAAPNIIAGGFQTGIAVVGNGTGNLFRQNSIYSNASLGIDLGLNGVTQNDTGDVDLANNFQNFPVLDSIATTIDGSLNSGPNRTFRIELYSSTSADPTGYGEGRTFIANTVVTTDGSGNASFSIPNPVAAGGFISATATDLATNDTSEFSAFRQVLVPTAVKFDAAKVTNFTNGVLVEWRTGLETDNLGFNVYRTNGADRELVNASPVAGSALLTAANIQGGFEYRYFDPKGDANSAYQIDSLDLAGHSETFGSFAVTESRGEFYGAERASESLTEIGLTSGGSSHLVDISETVKPSNAAIKQKLKTNIRPSGFSATPDGVRFEVAATGMYRVSAAELYENGLARGVDPNLLRLFADGAEVPVDPVIANNGVFEAVEFYGTAIKSTETDRHAYYLTSSLPGGLRIEKTVTVDGSPTTANHYRATVERRDRTIYFSGLLNGDSENFFGAVVGSAGASLILDASAAMPGTDAVLEVRLQGLTRVSHDVRVEINGFHAGDIRFESMMTDEFRTRLQPGILRDGENDVRIISLGGSDDISVVDTIRIAYDRAYLAHNGRLAFTAEGGQTIAIGGFETSAVRVFDVTDPVRVLEIGARLLDDDDKSSHFAVTPYGSGTRRMIAVADFLHVSAIGRDYSSDLCGIDGADLVVITKREFAGALEPLAALRRSQGLKVAVVDVQDIYDEFSSGLKSTAAIRDFLRMTQSAWRLKPRYALFGGDATFDPKGYLGGNGDAVPTKLVDTLSMETASDEWFGDFNGSGRSSFAIGRLPGRNETEIAAMVAKIVGYERQSSLNSATFVSDISDGFDFGGANETVRSTLPEAIRGVDIRRDETTGQATRDAVFAAFNGRQKLITYIGHGSLGIWRGSIFTRSDAMTLRNRDALPVVVAMTCLNGYFQHVETDSLAEALVKNPNGGAVAAWSSSGTTLPDSYGPMNVVVHRELLAGATLGEAHVRAKSQVSNQDLLKTWVLLGDPSMRLR